MVDVTPLLKPSQKIIQSYANGRFKVSGEVFEGGVIVGTDFVKLMDPKADLMNASQFAFLNGTCDVLLLGTGMTASLMTPAMRQAFRAEGLNAEIMDTGAACRTFNVLTAEGRQVVAVLKPV